MVLSAEAISDSETESTRASKPTLVTFLHVSGPHFVFASKVYAVRVDVDPLRHTVIASSVPKELGKWTRVLSTPAGNLSGARERPLLQIKRAYSCAIRDVI